MNKLTLTDEDIKIIKKKRNSPLFIIFGFLIVLVLYFLIVLHQSVAMNLIIIASMSLLLGIPILIIYKRFQKDIDAGYKNCTSGKIKIKNATSGKSRITYITIGNEKFVVTEKDYQSVEEGDEIEVHYTAHTSNCIYFRKK
jgi:hypothetical protein